MKTSMQVISLVADAVLAVRVPDEAMISIKTSELSMILGRHSPEKLAGLNIEGGNGRFILPSDSQSLLSTITSTGYVDTQVRITIIPGIILVNYQSTWKGCEFKLKICISSTWKINALSEILINYFALSDILSDLVRFWTLL